MQRIMRYCYFKLLEFCTVFKLCRGIVNLKFQIQGRSMHQLAVNIVIKFNVDVCGITFTPGKVKNMPAWPQRESNILILFF